MLSHNSVKKQADCPFLCSLQIPGPVGWEEGDEQRAESTGNLLELPDKDRAEGVGTECGQYDRLLSTDF